MLIFQEELILMLVCSPFVVFILEITIHLTTKAMITRVITGVYTLIYHLTLFLGHLRGFNSFLTGFGSGWFCNTDLATVDKAD